MTPSALAQPSERGLARAPGWVTLSAIGLAGCAATGISIALALSSDHVSEPAVRAALNAWVVLPYILAGLVAWRCRPDSRLGLLMIAAGFAMFLSSLSTANSPVCTRSASRSISCRRSSSCTCSWRSRAAGSSGGRAPARCGGYVFAFVLQLVAMLLGGFEPDNAIGVAAEPEASLQLLRGQLVAISASLPGIVVLARGGAQGGRDAARGRCSWTRSPSGS